MRIETGLACLIRQRARLHPLWERYANGNIKQKMVRTGSTLCLHPLWERYANGNLALQQDEGEPRVLHPLWERYANGNAYVSRLSQERAQLLHPLWERYANGNNQREIVSAVLLTFIRSGSGMRIETPGKHSGKHAYTIPFIRSGSGMRIETPQNG